MKRQELIACRLALGKRQSEVAKDLQISEVYVRKIESGDREPGRDTMIKFERYYKKAAYELFPDLYAEACPPAVGEESTRKNDS